MVYKNSFTFKGYSSSKPELVATKSNHYAILKVATSFKKNEPNTTAITHWHRIKLWSDLAQVANTKICKGSLVEISGFIVPDSYKNKEGKMVYAIDFIATQLDIFPNSPKNNNSKSTVTDEEPVKETFIVPDFNDSDFTPLEIDDLPF